MTKPWFDQYDAWVPHEIDADAYPNVVDMLLDAGHYTDAQRAYEAALERSPNRFNSLFGAARAAEFAGETATAKSFYAKLVEICAKPTGRDLQLAHARAYLE